MKPTSIKKSNLTPCPDKLRPLIEKFKMLPFKKDYFLVKLDFGSKKWRFDFELDGLLKAKQELEEKTKNLPEKFRKFIFYGDTLEGDFHTIDAVSRYEHFEKQQAVLLWVIAYGQDKDFEGKIPHWLVESLLKMRIETVEVKKENKKRRYRAIQFEPDEFIETLRGVEVERLKICEKCKRIFWAGRLDQKACNTRHANSLRVARVKADPDKRLDYAQKDFEKYYLNKNKK